ncbi:LAGLIDADG family homing endonuclease [Planobispora siamensis]|uniref:DOD-type homing endonuclease domain-containing protein n=1 Tax=Planobispora siamensis TaxID=936338 RepID=A0A8J3WQ33_9ACTN|nr:LAGLIDADG family homing endonuclease [Planobispora siamensis]GIH95416.1 hypothetical protein Psi01_60460 [Planobispora siamensis]
MSAVAEAVRHRSPGRSKEAARLFHDLKAAPIRQRRRFLASLDRADLRQVLTVAAREGGTPYCLWEDDPVGFVTDVLRENTWSKPREILSALPHHNKIAVPSCFASGKCVAWNEMIQLADGSVVRAADLVGTTFHMIGWQEDGTQTVRRATAEWNAYEPVFRITTDSGRTVVRNGAHPFWVATAERKARPRCGNGSISSGLIPQVRGWTPLRDIVADRDLVLVPEHVETVGDARWPEGHAAMLGYLLGDGGTTTNIGFSQMPGPALDEFLALTEKLGCRATLKKRAPGNERKHVELEVVGTQAGRNPVRDLARRWGILGCKAVDKRIPDEAWRLHPDELAAIAGRLFSCDGYVHVRTEATIRGEKKPRNEAYISLEVNNEGLVRDFQRLMIRLGVPGVVSATQQKMWNGNPFRTWKWVINSARDIARFAEVIDAPAKNEKIRQAVEVASLRKAHRTWRWRNAPAGYRWEVVKSVEQLPDERTVAIEVDIDHTWVDLFVEHNTWTASRALLWFALTRPPGQVQVITMAPTWRQVARLLWTEVRFAHGRASLPGTVDMVQMKLPMFDGHDEVVAYGLSGAPTNEHGVQGIHKQELLLIVDEAGGISHVIGNNLRGMTSTDGSHMLAIGNPPSDEEGSWFEGLCSRPEEALCIPISAFDTPGASGEDAPVCRTCLGTVAPHKVTKHLVKPSWITETIAEHGEDSAYVQSKVYARFPRGGPNRVLPSVWVDEAATSAEPDDDDYVPLPALGLADESGTWMVRRRAWIRLGVDVASDGGDELVIARCVGDLLTIQHTSAGSANANQVDVAGQVLAEIRKAEALRAALGTRDPIRVKVDAIGLGWGVVSTLQRWGEEGVHDAEIVGVDVSEGTDREPDGETLKPNLKRDEMWLAMRALLRPTGHGQQLRLRVDARTLAQLRSPLMGTNSGGKTVVESKKKMRLRGLSSPDRAEAALLSVYEPAPPKTKKKRARVIA